MGIFPCNSEEGCSISAQIFTDKQKDLVQTVIDGNAFKNPVKPDINSVNSAIATTQGMLAAVEFPDLVEWQGLSSTLTGLTNKVSDYTTHSNRVSGKNLSAIGPSDEPGFLGLYGIASANNSAKETMEEKNEDNFSPVFNSILGAASSTLKTSAATITNTIQDFISLHNGVTSGDYPEGFVEHAGDMSSNISGTSSQLNSMISQDNSSYSSALSYVERFGLGNMIMSSRTDPFFGGKVVDNVVTSNVREKLDAVVDESTDSPT